MQAVAVGNALVALERDRARAEREREKQAFSGLNNTQEVSFTGDLIAAGVALVWNLVKDEQGASLKSLIFQDQRT